MAVVIIAISGPSHGQHDVSTCASTPSGAPGRRPRKRQYAAFGASLCLFRINFIGRTFQSAEFLISSSP